MSFKPLPCQQRHSQDRLRRLTVACHSSPAPKALVRHSMASEQHVWLAQGYDKVVESYNEASNTWQLESWASTGALPTGHPFAAHCVLEGP